MAGPNRTRSWVAAVAAAAMGLTAGAASAQSADPPSEADRLLEQFQLKGRAAPAPDFVTRSRPAHPAPFLPVGTPHPDRPVKVLSAAELAAETAGLDSARERQQRRAGRHPAVVPYKMPAATPPRQNTKP